MKVFLDGRVLAAEEARLSPFDRGFTLGDGLFETIKVREGRPLRLADHWSRLRAGADLLRLPMPLAFDGLVRAIAVVLAANGLGDAVLRLSVSRGPGERGLLPPRPSHPTVLLTAQPPPPPPSPARAVVAESVRRNPFSPLARCKTLSALDTVLARLEAEERGADEALLLNPAGRVAESSIANLFVVTADGRAVTPPVAEGALPGIRRQALLSARLAEERPLTPDEVGNAREAFLTNALSVRPLLELNGRGIGDGQPGPLSRRLQEECAHE